MGYFSCDIFKKNKNKYNICKSLYYTGEWLHSPKLDEINEKTIKDIVTDVITINGEFLTPDEKKLTLTGLELLKRSKNYPKDVIERKLHNKYGTNKPEEVVELVKHVKDNGVYHLINKLNTNYSDLSELLVDFLSSDIGKYREMFSFLQSGFDVKEFENKVIPKEVPGYKNLTEIQKKIKNDQPLKPWEEENIKHFLQSRAIIEKLEPKKFISFFKDKIKKITLEKLKDYIRNTSGNSDTGDAGEQKVKDFFVSELGIDVPFMANEGNIVDMIFGVDMIANIEGEYYTLQVKPNNPSHWVKYWQYKNVDFIATYDEDGGVQIYKNKTGENLTDRLKKKYSPMKRESTNKVIENFFDTGKLINEIGDEETMGKLKRDIETIEKKSFDDLVSEYEIGKYINQFKDTYERQKKDFVYDKDNTKLTLTSFNTIWGKVFKLIQNLYILDLYKNVGKPSSGEKRSGSYSGVISSLLRVVGKYINDDETIRLTKLLINLNDYIEKLTMNEELIPKLRNDLWAIINKVKDKGGIDILSLLSKKVSSYSEYENSFLKKGFSKPIGKKAEGRIHDLKGGELSDMINSESTEGYIFDYVKNNIEKYVSSVDNIEKYDIISDRDFMLGDKTLINSGDKIEIKKNKHSEGQDSYYSEPLASPVKATDSNIRTDEVLKQKYSNVIDNLYNWLGGSGKSIGEGILKKLVKGTKGIFLENYIFIPIENIEFYLSNKGYNKCSNHRRLAIRYRLKPGKSIYKLTDDNNFEEIPYSGETEISKDYINCDGNEPKVIVDGSQIIQENSDFISEYVENFLDL